MLIHIILFHMGLSTEIFKKRESVIIKKRESEIIKNVNLLTIFRPSPDGC